MRSMLASPQRGNKKAYPILIAFLLRGFLGVGLMVFAYYQMEGFSESYLYVKEKSSPKKAIFQSVGTILDQPFFYLSSGRQCFAFISQDQKFVLKFMNQAKFDLPYFLRKIPFPYLEEKAKKRKLRSLSFYESFHLGKELTQQTAVLYAKLDREEALFPTLLVYDPIGYPKYIDLNQTHFILQKRGELIYPHLTSLEKEPNKFWNAVDSYLELVFSRIQKGIYDDDLNVDQNIGFIEGKAFLLDFGRLYRAQDLSLSEKKRELRRSTKFFERWLIKKAPEKLSLFQEKRKEIEKKLESFPYQEEAERVKGAFQE